MGHNAELRKVTGIKRHLQAVRREGEGTISFVYYSGHGAADPDTKINYLIPVDVTSAEDENLWINSLNLNNVIENLREQAPAATHYVVFDACRNELKVKRTGQKALTDKGFVLNARRNDRLCNDTGADSIGHWNRKRTLRQGSERRDRQAWR